MFVNFHPYRLHGTQVKRVLQRRANTWNCFGIAYTNWRSRDYCIYLSIYLSLEFETKFAIVRSVASPKFHENSYLDIFRRISYLLFSYVISRVIKILTFRIILNLEKVYNTCTIKTCCFFWFVLSPFTLYSLYCVCVSPRYKIVCKNLLLK